MADRMDAYGAGAGRPLDAAGGDAAEIETTVIRAEIVETRERMSDTLDEIGERLNPHVLKEQVTERVKDGIRDATIGRVEHMARNAADKVSDTKSNMADTIRDNPIPAAMVAVGLGWLLWNGRSESSSGGRARFASGYGDATGRSAYGGGPYAAGYPYGGNPYGGSAEYAGGYGAGAYGDEGEDRGAMDRVRDRASSVGSGAKERAHDLADRAGSAAGAVSERAHDLADGVVDRTRRGAGRLEDSFYANPLALGAVAAAIGLATGLAAPTTERETQLLGGARDRLVDRVKEAASETKDKAQHVAERVMDEARTASHEEGLVPG